MEIVVTVHFPPQKFYIKKLYKHNLIFKKNYLIDHNMAFKICNCKSISCDSWCIPNSYSNIMIDKKESLVLVSLYRL